MAKEWAIQDEATGEWWTGDGWLPSGYSDRDRHQPNVYPSFRAAVTAPPFLDVEYIREGARIVPAPPREMTDAECWEWFRTEKLVLVGQIVPKGWAIFGLDGLRLGPVYGGTQPTPCDAIRAARRKLEGGK